MADIDQRTTGAPTVPTHRWQGIRRDYDENDVRRLRGSVRVDYTFAELGARRLWGLLQSEDSVDAVAVDSHDEALLRVRAGAQALWVDVPTECAANRVRRINRNLTRADEIECAAGRRGRCWHAPVVVSAGDGIEEPYQAFERMKARIEAGAAGVVFEDAGLPAERFVCLLNAARLAADVMGVPTLLIARIDAEDLEEAIERGLAYAPYADLLWSERGTPDDESARRFSEAIHTRFLGKVLACGDAPSGARAGRAALGYRLRAVPRAEQRPARAPSAVSAAEYPETVRRILSGDASLPGDGSSTEPARA